MQQSRLYSGINRRLLHAAAPVLLALSLLPSARAAATNEIADTRLQSIRTGIRETQVLLESETNQAVRAAVEKRQGLLVQDLANMERRIAIEQRERSLRGSRKADPLTELKAFILSVKGDETIPRRQAKILDDQFLLLSGERVRLGARLAQLRTAPQPDPQAIADVELAIRIQDDKLTLVTLQQELADCQADLAGEVARVSEKAQSLEVPPVPTIKAMVERSRYLGDEEKRLGENRLRLKGFADRQENANASLNLSKAKAEQIAEAIAIRKERDRMERSRQHLLAWLFPNDDEKEKKLEQEQIDCQAEQVRTVENGIQTISRLSELYEKEMVFLKADLAGLRKRFAESFFVPAACILGILALYFLLTRLLLPLAYQHDRLFVARRHTGYIASLLVIVVAVRFFLEDLKDIGTVLGIAGAALVIALQDLCSAFAGWFVIMASGKIKVGDRVEISGTRGDVIDIELLRTTLNELDNWMGTDDATGRVVVIPNSYIFKEKVINYAHVHPFIWSRLDIIVTYETPAREAQETLWKILTEETRDAFEEARGAAGLMEKIYGARDATYEPKIVSSIDDSGVTFGLLFVTHYRRRSAMRNRLNARIIEEFGRNPRLQFAYPTTRQIPTPESGGFRVTLDPPR